MTRSPTWKPRTRSSVFSTPETRRAAASEIDARHGEERGGTLEQGLETLLKPLGLTWTLREDVLFITSREGAESLLETRTYRLLQPVRDGERLRPGTSRPKSRRRPGTGPVGRERFRSGRWGRWWSRKPTRSIGSWSSGTPRCCNCCCRTPNPRAVRCGARPLLKDILQQPTFLDFNETPFKTFVRTVAERHKFPAKLDMEALEKIGLDDDTPITCHLRGVTLQSALALILDQLGLVWTVRNEELVITTPESEAAHMLTITYNIRDLSFAVDGDSDRVIQMIAKHVAPASWDFAGGPAKLTPSEEGGTVQVRQTFQGHVEADRLLDQLRSFEKR